MSDSPNAGQIVLPEQSIPSPLAAMSARMDDVGEKSCVKARCQPKTNQNEGGSSPHCSKSGDDAYIVLKGDLLVTRGQVGRRDSRSAHNQ
jgi:hypothetical protein